MRNTDPTTAKVRIHLGDLVMTMSSIVYDKEIDGVYYVVREIDGWRNSTASKASVTPRPYGHGSWGGSAYLAERNLELIGDIVAETPEALEDAIEKLNASIPVSEEEPLVVHSFTSGIFHCMVKQTPEAEPIIDWKGQGKTEAEFSIQLVALDPRKLSGDGSGPTKSISTPAGTDNQVVMTNAKRGVLPPHLLTITDSNRPKIKVDGVVGEQWFDIDLRGGAPLIVDYDKKTVTRNGANVFGVMRGDWLDLHDKTNTFRYSALNHGAASTLNVKSYDSMR